MSKQLTAYKNPVISVNTSSKTPQKQLIDLVYKGTKTSNNLLNITEGISSGNINNIQLGGNITEGDCSGNIQLCVRNPYQYIINPKTNIKVSIFSKLGYIIITKYLKYIYTDEQ